MPWPGQAPKAITCNPPAASYDLLVTVARELGVSLAAATALAIEDFLDEMCPDRARAEGLANRIALYRRSKLGPARPPDALPLTEYRRVYHKGYAAGRRREELEERTSA